MGHRVGEGERERLGDEVTVLVAVGAISREIEALQHIERLVGDLVVAGDVFVAAVAQWRLVQGAGPVGGEIIPAENPPGAAHVAFDGGRDAASIEAARTLARDEAQGAGEGAGVESIGLRLPASAGKAPARHEDGARRFAELRPRYSIHHPETVGIGEGNTGVGRFDGRSQHLLQRQPPVVRLCLAETRDRARHRGCERPGSGAVTLGEGMPVVGRRSRRRLEHVVPGGKRRPAVGVDGDETAPFRQPQRDVAVAADAAGGGLDHEGGERGRAERNPPRCLLPA